MDLPAIRLGRTPWVVCLGTAALVLGVMVALVQPIALRTWTLLLLAPLAEETVFRAGLQESLLRRMRTPLAANGVTALAFALAHVAVRGDAAAFAVAVPALAIGAVYGHSRRLGICVVLHATMNALWLAWGAMGSAPNIGP